MRIFCTAMKYALTCSTFCVICISEKSSMKGIGSGCVSGVLQCDSFRLPHFVLCPVLAGLSLVDWWPVLPL